VDLDWNQKIRETLVPSPEPLDLILGILDWNRKIFGRPDWNRKIFGHPDWNRALGGHFVGGMRLGGRKAPPL
jgi:hypothetical protein